jgi:nucleotide-binding universal stress UspA family protein
VSTKKILVCLDGSPRAPGVLAAAVRLARATGSQVHLFRGVGVPPDVPAIAWSVAPGDLEGVLLGEAQKALEGVARHLPAELVAGTSVALGVPWQAICEASQRQDVDLVVIGSHGYGGADRLLGTTAAKVVNHADRSVLVVRASDRLAT